MFVKSNTQLVGRNRRNGRSFVQRVEGRIGCASDLVRPADRQRIRLLDGPEIAGSRADVAVSEQEADSLHVARLAKDVCGSGAPKGFGPVRPWIKTNVSCPGFYEAAQLPSRQRS